MKFEWDEQKRLSNLEKHGLDFADARHLFAGPVFVQTDNREQYGEDRSLGIGFLKATVAVVVFVEYVDENRCRIISMRKALKYERELFRRYLND